MCVYICVRACLCVSELNRNLKRKVNHVSFMHVYFYIFDVCVCNNVGNMLFRPRWSVSKFLLCVCVCV